MKHLTALAAGLALAVSATQASAWTQPTHKNIVKDALAFMNSSYATAEMKRAYQFYVGAAGSEAKAGDILGQAAYDVDDFKDTRLGGWWVGYERAPVYGLAASIVSYTSYWHFINMGRQGDAHGNDHGGYDYRYHKVDGGIADVDWYAMVYLYNRGLKDDDYNTTEANYRQGSRSNWKEHYDDFQKMAFQPIDNLANYWFEQFKRAPSLQTIGYSLHATGDVAQPHHTWITSANGHSSWEGWVEDNYQSNQLNNPAAVAAVVTGYSAAKPLRDTITQTAQVAYQHPEPLYDTSHTTRLRVAKKLIPESIASTVTVLTKGANHFYGQSL
ncbi:hypothetical protein [Atopomonas sediminilitoris]|uniref:hypothetical protein n=1 Tax=Atopomonas sediminilitoris TaxID=2919919 RepID=UPI001F4EB9AB|nr:hypothetical protein [Atopomonas sediminilitoris]MCJ8169357.1 hypothetical protein [Atopomonas sediminilitoris]